MTRPYEPVGLFWKCAIAALLCLAVGAATARDHFREVDVLKRSFHLLILAALSGLIAGCGPASEPPPTLYTIPTYVLPTATVTLIVTTPVLPSEAAPTETAAAVAEVGVGATGTPTLTQEPCTPDAEFEADVTLPDDSLVAPGAPITKVWRLRNSGTCNWNSSYSLVFAWGELLGDAPQYSLPDTLAGESVDVAIQLKAPSVAGTYVSAWRLVSPDGNSFGTEPYLQIIVTNGLPLPTPTKSGNSAPTLVARTPVPLPTSSGGTTTSPYPGISGITSHARQIFLAGRARGNRANVFSKVGDSITVEWYFLGPIGEGYVILDKYTHLQSVIDYFSTATARDRNSFANTSLAATGGWPAWAPLDPGVADPACAGKAPLDCEYDAVKPSIALIMLGTNDVIVKYSVQQFEGPLQQDVERTIAMGVIPVLYTIPWCVCGDVGPFNDAIIRTARAYDIPLVDYYSQMELGLNHGVRDDGIHPSIPPDGFVGNFDPEHLKYGYNIRNLMTLQVLDALWRQVLSY